MIISDLVTELSSDFADGRMEMRLVDGKGEYREKGADTWIPFSRYDLLVSDHNTSHSALSSTVPAGVTDGLFFAICSGGSSFKNLPIIDGDGILASETVYEVNQTGGSGVMLGVKILKCNFKPGGKILVKQTETATEATTNASSSNLNLLFG